MNARHAAREIALLVLFQLTNKDGEFLPAQSIEINKVTLQQMLLASVRAMVSLAKESIKAAAEDISKVTVSLVEMEQEHPTNLATPLNAPVQPVPLPNSRELIEKLETCLQAAEILYESAHFPELVQLSKIQDVQQYAIRLIQWVAEKHDPIDYLLNQYSDEWRVDRLVKMDRLILRLAACEMNFVQGVDFSVSINEAVELSKKFSTAESYRFINGVLGKIAEVLTANPDTPLENLIQDYKGAIEKEREATLSLEESSPEAITPPVILEGEKLFSSEDVFHV